MILGSLNWKVVVSLLASWLIMGACTMRGVNFLGRISMITVPLPYAIITILLIMALFLPGAKEGFLEHIFASDFSHALNQHAWMEAAQQVCYSLGVGFGNVLTLASYNKKTVFQPRLPERAPNIYFQDAIVVSIADTIFSILCAITVFLVFGFMSSTMNKSIEDIVKGGEALVFITIPEAMGQMPAQWLFALLFFLMIFMLAFTTQFPFIEVVDASIFDQFPRMRKHGGLCTSLVCLAHFVPGLLMCTNVSVLCESLKKVSNFQSGIYYFNVFDEYTGSALMLLIFLEVSVVAYVFGIQKFMRHLRLLFGEGKNFWAKVFGPCGWIWAFIWKIFLPVSSLAVVILTIIDQINTTTEYGKWQGWCIFAIPLAAMPVFAMKNMKWKRSNVQLLEEFSNKRDNGEKLLCRHQLQNNASLGNQLFWKMFAMHENDLVKYLRRRYETLTSIYPEWESCNCMIENSRNDLKRKVAPICIPPSWDLIRSYVGPCDESADGFDDVLHGHRRSQNNGDDGEAQFHEQVQTIGLGGVVIGNIDSRHMLGRQDRSYFADEENCDLPDLLKTIVKEVVNEIIGQNREENYFELDFVLLHPGIGIYQIEVKAKPFKNLLLNGINQLKRQSLKQLFLKFCHLLFPQRNALELWDRYYAGGGVYFASELDFEDARDDLTNSIQRAREQNFDVFFGIRDFEQVMLGKSQQTNIFTDAAMQAFAVFLCGFRPDFYISPVLSVLKIYENITSQRISVEQFFNTNYDFMAETKLDSVFRTYAEEVMKSFLQLYAKSYETNIHDFENKLAHCFTMVVRNCALSLKEASPKQAAGILHREMKAASTRADISNVLFEKMIDVADGICREDIVHLLKPMQNEIIQRVNNCNNKAISLQQYLLRLKWKGLIKHIDIVFPDGRTEIYLTKHQVAAVEVFDDNGDYKNMRQIITGLPGTGKSIILLIKLFILKQIRIRNRLVFASWFTHDNIVKKWNERNECPCCRKIEFHTEHDYLERLFGYDRPHVEFGDGDLATPDRRFNETSKLRASLNSTNADVVMDERHANNNLDRFKIDDTRFANVFSIAVFTGGYILNSFNVALPKNLIAPIELTTVFRSTNSIQRYLAQLTGYPRISGHKFAGVPVEEWEFRCENAAFLAASRRINQLNDLLGTATSTRYIGIVSEYPMKFSAHLAYRAYIPHTEMPECAHNVPSLEFPILLVICSKRSAKQFLPISASRAICHLIIFLYGKDVILSSDDSHTLNFEEETSGATTCDISPV